MRCCLLYFRLRSRTRSIPTTSSLISGLNSRRRSREALSLAKTPRKLAQVKNRCWYAETCLLYGVDIVKHLQKRSLHSKAWEYMSWDLEPALPTPVSPGEGIAAAVTVMITSDLWMALLRSECLVRFNMKTPGVRQQCGDSHCRNFLMPADNKGTYLPYPCS